MEVNVVFNAVSLFTGILAWTVIGFFVYRLYKRQNEKPKVWRLLVVLFVGLFSFSFHLNAFGTIINLSILPLGVWILYAVLKGKKGRWNAYRSFAWLGFGANFILLAFALVSIPIDHLFYPKDKLTTYMSDTDQASIIHIHPSANERILDKEQLLMQLNTMRQETIYSENWYKDTYIQTEPNERFPYQLIGTTTKWGSGLKPVIYIEDDGKGILISTSKSQHYFRSEHSLLEEEEE